MYEIKSAAVIGAGTMGLGIAGQLANAGVPVVLLDIPSEGDNRNAVCERALERLSLTLHMLASFPELGQGDPGSPARVVARHLSGR